MKVSQNIGIVNALIRITVGFTILSWCTAKLVKKPWRDSYLVMAVIGAMKVGEGILRYCPVTALVEKNGDSSSSKEANDSSGKSVKDFFDVKNFDLGSFLSKSSKNTEQGSSEQSQENTQKQDPSDQDLTQLSNVITSALTDDKPSEQTDQSKHGSQQNQHNSTNNDLI